MRPHAQVVDAHHVLQRGQCRGGFLRGAREVTARGADACQPRMRERRIHPRLR